MTKICLCLTAKTIAQDLAVLNRYRQHIDIAELRVDYLANDELESVRRFPELAGLPVILTVRRTVDGGFFNRGEAARIVIISKALAFANTDHRHNFAYVDLEEDLDIPSLEEVARVFGTQIIRSFHNLEGTDSNLIERVNSLYHVGDEIAKIALTPHSLDDVQRIIRTAKELKGKESIVMAMGDMGQCTRILAAKYGGYLTYVSPPDTDGLPCAAPGHIDPVELTDLYRFRSINADTAVYGITGYPLLATMSPEIHNQAFAREKMNAVYLRLPAQNIAAFFNLANELDLCGASVTVPHKETVLPYLNYRSSEVAVTGACNTLVRKKDGWHGYNTDAPGFSGSLLDLMGRTHLKRLKVTVLGAGGAARSIVAELSRLGAKVLILNRDTLRAKLLADIYRFEYGRIEDASEKKIRSFSDVIVQTTSVGMAPESELDPLPYYRFTGKEIVMDIIYKPEQTRFLTRAIAAGCTTINGYDMLLRQAKYQFDCFVGTGPGETES